MGENAFVTMTYLSATVARCTSCLRIAAMTFRRAQGFMRTQLRERHTSTRHLYQRLAISLWRGNASAWIHRSPQLAPSLDGVI